MVKIKKIIPFFSYLCLIILFIICAYFITQCSTPYMNDDMASLNVLVNEEIQFHQMWPSEWIWGNEIVVISPHLFLFPLRASGLSAIDAQIVSSIIVLAIFSVTVFFLFKKLMGKMSAVLITAFILCESSYAWINFIYVYPTYTICLILSLVPIICFCLQGKKYSFLCPAFVFLACLTGPRQLELTLFPILATIFFYVLMKNKDTFKESIKSYFQEFLFILGAGILGIVLYKTLVWQYGPVITDLGNVFFVDTSEIIPRFEQLLASYMSLWGYGAGYALGTPSGIFNLICLFTFTLLTIIGPLLLLKDLRHHPLPIQRYSIAVTISLLLEVALLIFLSLDAGAFNRYILLQQIMVAPMGIYYFAKKVAAPTHRFFYDFLIIVFVLCFCFSSLTLIKKSIELPKGEDRYESVIETLQENGLDFGYAPYWDSYSYTVMSDYAVEIMPIVLTETAISPFPYLTSERFYEDSYHTGKTFVMLPSGQSATWDPQGQYADIQKTLELDNYTIYIYDDNFAFAE